MKTLFVENLNQHKNQKIKHSMEGKQLLQNLTDQILIFIKVMLIQIKKLGLKMEQIKIVFIINWSFLEIKEFKVLKSS